MSEPLLSFVEHAGHRLAVLSHPNPSASRLPVVWIHGLTASVRFWEAAMYPEIRAERSWYSISLPLHHPSTYDGNINANEISEFLLAELIHRAVEECVPAGPFHMVGYSLGAFACLNYAAKFPGRVRSVVSVGGFMRGRARGLEGVLQFFSAGTFVRKALFHAGWWIMQRHVIFLKLATLAYARQWRRLLRYPYLDATLDNIFPDVSRHSITGQRVLFRYLLEMDLLDETERLDIPTLVVAGTADPIIPYAHQEECARRLPQGQLLPLAGVGHVAFAEASLSFHDSVIQWLRDWDQDASGVTTS